MPPLDERGNSVRGVRVCEELSRSLDLHVFKHAPRGPSPVRRTFTLAEVASKRQRDPAVAAEITREGARARAFELQGDLGFTEAEQVIRAVLDAPAEFVVLDTRRVRNVDAAAIALLAGVLAVAPTREAPAGTRVIELELSEESEAIIQELIRAGYHKTRQEVLTAALEAMMIRDGWPLPRGGLRVV